MNSCGVRHLALLEPRRFSAEDIPNKIHLGSGVHAANKHLYGMPPKREQIAAACAECRKAKAKVIDDSVMSVKSLADFVSSATVRGRAVNDATHEARLATTI